MHVLARRPTPEGWADERVVAVDGAPPLPAVAARSDYIAWHSDFGPTAGRPADAASVNRAVVRAGGTRGFAKDPAGNRHMIFRDVLLMPWLDAVARRSEDPIPDPLDPPDVVAALTLLAPLTRDSRDLDIAYLRLTGTPARRLCDRCGRITRRRRRHVACHA